MGNLMNSESKIIDMANKKKKVFDQCASMHFKFLNSAVVPFDLVLEIEPIISLLLYRFAICLRKADYPPCFFTAFHNIFYHKTPPNALRIRRCFGFNLFVSSESNRLCLLPYWCPPKREAFSFIRFLHHFSTPIASRIVFS